MAMYEYECVKCKEVAEKMRKVAERDNPVTCVKCGLPMQRIISLGNFVLKGGGWYASGYSSTKR